MSTLAKRLKPQKIQRGLRIFAATPHESIETERLLRGAPALLPALMVVHDYAWVIQEGIRGLEFTEKALAPMMEVAFDRSANDPSLLVYLDEDVHERLSDSINREDFGLSESEGEALVQQLRSLNSLQQLALARTLQAAVELRARSQMSAADACRSLGLSVA
ncbi:hypothetical protein [Gemmatimonas sp.]|jgi:hypothetical protein|uniref:hypothetical protein n=1 Tax=Gemmatimonas sp. TaxID=1962908 RepID=UPI0037C15CE4